MGHYYLDREYEIGQDFLDIQYQLVLINTQRFLVVRAVTETEADNSESGPNLAIQ